MDTLVFAQLLVNSVEGCIRLKGMWEQQHSESQQALLSCWFVDCLLTRLNIVETMTVTHHWTKCGEAS